MVSVDTSLPLVNDTVLHSRCGFFHVTLGFWKIVKLETTRKQTANDPCLFFTFGSIDVLERVGCREIKLVQW